MNNDFMANMFIDMIQNAKKTFVDTWIKDEAMSAPMHAFIKVQSEFTKEALKQTNLIANAAGEAMSKAAK